MVSRRSLRSDPQADDGARRTADQLHDVVQPHVGHIDHLARLSLADTHDAIVGLQLAVLVGRSAGDDLGDLGVAFVVGLQRGTDAFQIEPHQNAEVVQRTRGHIRRVRIEAGRDRGQELLEQLVPVGLLPDPGVGLVTPLNLLAGFLIVLFIRLGDQQIVLDQFPPPFAGFGLVLGILQGIRVRHQVLVDA